MIEFALILRAKTLNSNRVGVVAQADALPSSAWV